MTGVAAVLEIEFLSCRGVARNRACWRRICSNGSPCSAGPCAAPAPSAGPPQTFSGLSPREIEVLRLIATGRSNPQIAEALVISLNTVQRHVSNILAKTGAANRTEAALYARDRGLA